ncbi:hypothetical protein BX600DRAFT_48463 [Xylariales sp. PMI_506]|nr:hypothetical protein BX600DRAFT_48463 [Xylariales sp. PMI_506]
MDSQSPPPDGAASPGGGTAGGGDDVSGSMDSCSGNLQSSIYVAIIITLALSTITLALRFVSRKTTKVKIWWDDYLCIVAYLFGLAWCIVMFSWLQHGLGKCLADSGAPMTQTLDTARLHLFLLEVFYGLAVGFAKLAVLAFYWRLFAGSLRTAIIVLLVATVIWTIIRTFIGIFHCVPVQAFWTQAIVMQATCVIDDSKFFFGTVMTHFLLDVVILILPVIQVRKLQLRRHQKIGVIALFAFGILVCIASIIVLVKAYTFNSYSNELAMLLTPILIWSTVECNFAVVSACLPMLRAVFMMLMRRFFPNSSFNSSDAYGNHNDYANQYARSHTQSKSFVKMSTLRTTQQRGPGESDDSIDRLEQSIHAGSSVVDDERHILSGEKTSQITVTTGKDDNRTHSPDSTMPENGIVVVNEYNIQLSTKDH